MLRDGRATTENVAQVDPGFFKVFTLPMIRGDAATALAQPNNVVIDEAVARKYFGDRDPIGQSLTVAMDSPASYRVTGVFRTLPVNSDFKLSIPIPRTPPSENWYHWDSTSLGTYLQFDNPAAARAFAGRLNAFVDRRGKELEVAGGKPSDVLRLRLLPVTRLHLEPQGQDSESRKTTVVTQGRVGVLTLLIAIVNHVNLATARAGLRAREVAMRKVLGASRTALVRQFLGEAVLTVALATLGASSADIVRLLVGQFLRPVLIANGITWPLAYAAMRTWPAGFEDRIALSPWFFIAASVLAVAIATLTVLGRSLRASRVASAWALRHD